MIQFTCPECNATLKAIEERAGTRFKCGKCGNPVKVPGQAVPARPVAPPSSPLPTAPVSTTAKAASRQDRRQQDDGPPITKKSRTLLWVLIGVGGLLFVCCGAPTAFLVFIGFGHQVQQNEQNKMVEEGKDAIKISAVQLFEAYDNNEVDANNKYKGRVVEVAGTVYGIKEDYVELNEGRHLLLGLVHVSLAGESRDKMASLKKGDTIKVRGICTGKFLAWVNIENAVLLE